MREKEIRIGVLSEVGDVKPTNQDCVLFKYDQIDGNNVGLFIVADGMGGLAHGEEVSGLVVTFFNHWWGEELMPFLSNCRDIRANAVDNILNMAIVQLNKLAVDFSRQIDKKSGSTISLLLVLGDEYFIKNIGDSRIYLIRNNKKIQLTEDQSLVADMVRNNRITEAEARQHVRKNVLTMCLGVFEDVKVFSNQGQVKRGDIFLLCCDGFYNYVSEEDIIPILNDSKTSDFNQKAVLLRRKIPQGGAKDNVSIILVQFGRVSKVMKRILSVITTSIIITLSYFIFNYLGESNYIKYLFGLVRSAWK